MSDLPRLIATDLDGTLLNDDYAVSARTRRALEAAGAAGIEVLFVTARAPRAVHDIADQAGHEAHAVCSNGAILYDVGTRTILLTDFIAKDLVTLVCRRLSEVLPGLHFAVETGQSLQTLPGFVVPWNDECSTVDHYTDFGPAGKLFVRLEGLDNDALVAVVRDVVGSLVTCTHSGGQGFVELTAAGVSKLDAVMDYCASRGIDRSQVLAFGDMPNDLDLLGWAGGAYAPRNAHTSVRALIPVIDGNNEDGVAKVLENLLSATDSTG
ncbi:HAD family hydrolase [Saccharothrix syringae]|uniref:HAD family hydrolase n=1 Tax=Saccharothrix syringae TaxID=103733 RepID=UPI0014774001|nr:HAD-IIB family hydrolase [Saccharothrix syringae]